MSQTIYSYVDLSLRQVTLSENALYFRGTWASNGTYHAGSRDTVDYGPAKYLALQDSVGVNPRATPVGFPSWAGLSIVVQGTGTQTHTPDEAYALANTAYNAVSSFPRTLIAGSYAQLRATASSIQNCTITLTGRNYAFDGLDSGNLVWNGTLTTDDGRDNFVISTGTGGWTRIGY